jgi:UDP-N-acetylmuramyl pentapeptide synthase
MTTLEVKKYLKKIKSPKNTLNIIKNEKYTLIDDSYNLSED